MSKRKKINRVLSLLVIAVLTLGSFSSLAYAEKGFIRLALEDLKEEAAAKIMPEVKEDLKKSDTVEVLVYLKDQVDTARVAEATRKAVAMEMTPYNTKLAIRRAVVQALQDKAEVTQRNLLEYLQQEKDKGNIEEFKSYHIVNMIYVKGSKEIVENLSYRAEVAKIYKNKTHHIEKIKLEEVTPDSDNSIEWNVGRVKADMVWDLGIDGTGAVVGSLDSGVDWTHPALKNKWRGYDPVNDEIVEPEKSWFDPIYETTLPQDSDGHGTHVMGTIVGQEPDGSNKIGVAPGARWISARVFDAAGNTTDQILLDAAEWMLHPGGDPGAAPDVVNNSWGGLDGIDDWYRQAVINWCEAGIFPVFSAGNQRLFEPEPWPGSIVVPANYPESFAVAATDINDKRGSFSKLGPSPYDETMIKPEISAPGVNVRSSIPGGYALADGTSMAAPHVTGTVALMISANSALTVEEIRDILTGTARPLTDETYRRSPNFGYGYGLLDAYGAVTNVASGIGLIEGKVLVEGEDLEDVTIIHEQKIKEILLGMDAEIEARVIDDVAVMEVELLMQPEGKSYWYLIPMDRISGNHKDGIYRGIVSYDILQEGIVKYRIRARDYAGEARVTDDYFIEVLFGVRPGEYMEGFESEPMGWIFNGDWQWGEAVEGVDPEPYEGRGLAGTLLGGNHSYDADSWMISPPIDLRDSSLEEATFRFHHWYDTYSNNYYGVVYVTNDYGQNWTQVGPQYSNSSNGWKEVVVDLREYIGSQNPVYIGFRFVADGFYQRLGWYIDNVRIVTIDTEAPTAPLNLTATTSAKGIKLSWDVSIDGDVSYYRIYRSDVQGGPYDLIGEVSINTYLDTTAPKNIEQFYVVTAVDLSGNESQYSNEASGIALEYVELYGSDFEEDNGGFTTGVTYPTEIMWEWGTPTTGPGAAASGEKLWATKLHDKYVRSSSYIESPDITIPEDHNAVLVFNHWYDMEKASIAWDYGQVQVSKDGGQTWVNITPTPDGKYSGHVRQWFYEELPLTAYKGDTIKIRFFFNSDAANHFDGWYVDDVYVIALPEGEQPEAVRIGLGAKPAPSEAGERVSYAEIFKRETEGKEAVYLTVSDEEVKNTPMSRGAGIPDEGATVTVLETGRTVKTNPVTGEYRIFLPLGTYTIRAEAYGFIEEERQVTVTEEPTKISFLLAVKPRGTITGRAYDRHYGNPAANALISLVEDKRVAPVRADEEGNFTIPDVLIGTYTLRVIADGFETGEFTVTVSPNEVTYVELGLKRYVGYPGEIAYDDGTAENALVLNQAGNGLAVRFTPEGLGKVKGLNIYLWGEDWPDPGGNRLGFVIYDIVNGTPVQVGEPIFVDNLTRGGWNYIDLSSYAFLTDRDFFISTIQDLEGTSCPGTAVDKSSPHGDRSYLNIMGEFIPLADADAEGALMMRAVMEYAVLTPVITNLEEVNYTNQDSITVEGTVIVDTIVNVYVNGEKKASVNADNLRFSAEVELPLEENTIMVTAEMNEVETEPTPALTVIKDQVLPELTVERPEDNIKINTDVVHVEGYVSDNRGLKQLLINGKVARVDEYGHYHERVIVENGTNIITVRAIDLAGNETVVERIVHVGLDLPEVTNIKPDEDVVLRAGDVLVVRFNAPAGGTGYFRLIVPIESENMAESLGIPVEEISDGLYEGTWTVPEGVAATGLQVQIIYTDPYGNEVVALAAGRVTIIGNMRYLANNTVIVDNEGFDINYLNRNSSAQAKLIQWLSMGRDAYIKVAENTIVDIYGQLVSIEALPQYLIYYDSAGNVLFYEK